MVYFMYFWCMNKLIIERVQELQELIQDPIYQNGIVGGSLLVSKFYNIFEKHHKEDFENGFNIGIKKINID